MKLINLMLFTVLISACSNHAIKKEIDAMGPQATAQDYCDKDGNWRKFKSPGECIYFANRHITLRNNKPSFGQSFAIGAAQAVAAGASSFGESVSAPKRRNNGTVIYQNVGGLIMGSDGTMVQDLGGGMYLKH